MRKKKTKRSTLPRVIYVVMMDDGNGGKYLAAHIDYTDIEDGQKVGTYELTDKSTKFVQHSLE